MTTQPQKVEVSTFLEEREKKVLLDVRTPAEYNRGHIPGAANLPLLSDAERAEVGTLYKQVSRDAAFARGLELVGPRLTAYVERASELAGKRSVGVHCWRGGMRSNSMAQLFAQAGMDVQVLEGGYKAYRRYVLDRFATSAHHFIVLGGKTGSGKTEMLHHLRSEEEQVLDLEALARHKGSAFGAFGQEGQPSVEQFENELHDVLSTLQPGRRTWVENESRSIGKVFLPEGFWERMKSAPLVHVEVPFERRVQRLIAEYAHFPKEELLEALRRIERRMGPQHAKAATEALACDDFHSATTLALTYYDKAYALSTAKGNFSRVLQPEFYSEDCKQIAISLIQYANEHDL